MEVGIKVFIDGEERSLEEVPNEYLAGIEQECKRIRVSNDRWDRVIEKISDKINKGKS